MENFLQYEPMSEWRSEQMIFQLNKRYNSQLSIMQGFLLSYVNQVYTDEDIAPGRLINLNFSLCMVFHFALRSQPRAVPQPVAESWKSEAWNIGCSVTPFSTRC